jgi:hypothetical protein
LPAEWDTFYEKRGPLPAIQADERHSPRFYLRSPAKLEFHHTLPARPRPDKPEKVLIKDISRIGLALLHSEPLYPLEQLRVTLIDGAQHVVEVARCRRVKQNCFIVAGRFVDTATESPQETLHAT